MKNYFRYVLLISFFALQSCAVEKYNLSPLNNSLTSSNDVVYSKSTEFSIDKNINAAEISQLINTFPSFKNTAVDTQVSQLKIHLTDYLQALKANNIAGKIRSLDNIEKNYKKIQNLRKFLDADNNETLNRYLVRIKTNIAEIETLSKTDS
jgi:hypothetical protein